MYLVNLKANNFQSFKKLEYNFVRGVPVLVLGENLTDDGQDSNGSGKTVLMSAIEYCVLHTTSKKVTDQNLIYWWDGSDSSDLSLSIHCPIRKQTLLIERIISKKGGASQLSINDIIKYKFEDRVVNEIDKFIIDWIGISKEDLQNFFIISKFKYVSFFNASNLAVNQLIGRFSNANIISGIEKDILSNADDLEIKRSSVLSERDKLLGMLTIHEQNLEKELCIDKNVLLQNRLEEIDKQIIEIGEKSLQCHTEIGTLNDEIKKINETIEDTNKSLVLVSGELSKLNNNSISFQKRYQEVDDKIMENNTEKSYVSSNYDALVKQGKDIFLAISDIEKNIEGSVKCPKCNYEFVIGDLSVDINEERIALEEAQKLYNTVNEKIDSLNQQVIEFDKCIKNLRQDKLVIESEEKELNTLKRNINIKIQNINTFILKLQGDVKAKNIEISNHENLIKSLDQNAKLLKESKGELNLSNFDNKERIEAIKVEIEIVKGQINDSKNEESRLSDEIFDIKNSSLIFKEFIQYLSVKVLKILQGYANVFLEHIKSDLRVKMEGYKIKSDGTLSDKITTYIIRDGEQKEFGNFSGGERARLECAVILALQQAINSTNKFGGLDALIIDEIFESSDAMGINTLTSSLMGLGKSVMLTTHVPGANYECPIVKIVKVDRVSYIYN